MAKLIEAAQRMMDLYFQDYAPNDSFITVDDFKYQIATTYSTMLNALYQQERKYNRQQDGFSNIEIPAAWMIEEKAVIQTDKDDEKMYINTQHQVFSFDFDNAANGIQDIYSPGRGCTYRKISLNERKFKNVVPPASVVFFYLNKSNEVVFWHAKEDAKVIIQYVPKVVGEENDCVLSDNIISTLQPVVLETMFKAKNGNFIQKLDNQNPNIVPGQQIDPAVK